MPVIVKLEGVEVERGISRADARAKITAFRTFYSNARIEVIDMRTLSMRPIVPSAPGFHLTGVPKSHSEPFYTDAEIARMRAKWVAKSAKKVARPKRKMSDSERAILANPSAEFPKKLDEWILISAEKIHWRGYARNAPSFVKSHPELVGKVAMMKYADYLRLQKNARKGK